MTEVYTGKLTRDIEFGELKLKSGTEVDHFVQPNGLMLFLDNGWWLVDDDDVCTIGKICK